MKRTSSSHGRARSECHQTKRPGGAVHELLGSASVFTTVVTTIVNDALAGVSGDHALTLGQLRFLGLIAQDGESNMTDIARSVAISNPAVSRTLDTLVESGLVAQRSPRTAHGSPTTTVHDVLSRFGPLAIPFLAGLAPQQGIPLPS